MGKTEVTVNNQILLMNGKKSVCLDMDGVSYSTQFDKDDPYNGCRICFNKANPGILFPIGKLKLFEKVIAKGSNGTLVYKGTYDGLPVVAERIPKADCHFTDEVIQILKESDPHPNIVRFIAREETEDFVFFVYERCECTLHDLILSFVYVYESDEYRLTLPGFTHLKLWKPDGNSPSECLLKLMRGIFQGIVRLHELGIIPNLNPRQILIRKGTSGLTAKVLGMGISTTGIGIAGDSFDLGNLFIFSITGLNGTFYNNKVKKQLKRIPEAYDLISRLHHRKPESRPTSAIVYNHPLLCSAETRFSFLKDTNDILQSGKYNPRLQQLLERLKQYQDWDQKLDIAVINEIQQNRPGRKSYNYKSVCDLLLAIRNKYVHYADFSPQVKSFLGVFPIGFDEHLSDKLRGFVMEVYKVMEPYRHQEDLLAKYYDEYQFK